MVFTKKRVALWIAAAAMVLAASAGGFVLAKVMDTEAPDGFSRDAHRDWKFIETSWSTPARARVEGDAMTVLLAANARGLAYQGVVDKAWKDATGGDFQLEVDTSKAARSDNMEIKFKVTLDHHHDFLAIQSDGVDGLLLIQAAKGGRTETKIPLDWNQDRYWRMRHDRAADQVVWLTSPDGQQWTERRREPRRMDLTKTKIEIYAGTFRPVPAPGRVTLRGCC